MLARRAKGNGRTHRSALFTFSIPLTREVFDRIFANSTALYLVGEIRYVDAFEKKRWIDFTLYSTGPTGIGGAVSTFEEDSDTNNREQSKQSK